jgi:hypothetical protein
MKTARLLSSAGLLVLIAACDESFSPAEIAGTYRLRTIDGTPPPVIELATTECDQFITDGVLVLETNGTHALTLTISLDCTRGGGQISLLGRDYVGTFSVDGDRLEFASQPGGDTFLGQADEGALTVDLPSATIQGLMLEMRFEEEPCDVCVPQPQG